MKKLSPIPTFTSSLRIVALPLFFYLLQSRKRNCVFRFAGFLCSHRLLGRLSSEKIEGNITVWRLLRCHNRLHSHVWHICIFLLYWGLSNLATAFNRRSFHSIHSHKLLFKKTLRSRGQVPWKRPLHRRCFNLTLANPSGLCFCTIRFRWILFGFHREPYSKFNQKRSLN